MQEHEDDVSRRAEPDDCCRCIARVRRASFRTANLLQSLRHDGLRPVQAGHAVQGVSVARAQEMPPEGGREL